MTRSIKSFARRFFKEERGSMVIEFALVIPIVFTIFMTSVEMGIYQLRQMFLDRGVDMAVRNVRLNTGADYEHDEVKTMICGFAGFLEDCDSELKLSLTPVAVRSFSGFNAAADCSDKAEDIAPVQFIQGGEHQMMLMRACYMFKPVFPTSGLGYAYTKDGTGRSKMFAVTAFVQEPQK